MHLFLSQYWRIVPGRTIPRLSSHLQRVFDEVEGMPFDCDSFRFFQGFDDVETVPKEVVDPLSSEWNVSLGHLKVSYQRVEQLVALNQQWLILNHTIYLVKPMSVGEWRVILAEYIHRQRD